MRCDKLSLRRIEVEQNRIARIITGYEWSIHSTTLHRNFDEINQHSSRYHARLGQYRDLVHEAELTGDNQGICYTDLLGREIVILLLISLYMYTCYTLYL